MRGGRLNGPFLIIATGVGATGGSPFYTDATGVASIQFQTCNIKGLTAKENVQVIIISSG